MLRVTTRYTKMKMKMNLLLLLCAFVVAAAAAELYCDPQHQKEENGECCEMCRPGTRKSTTGTCAEPQCMDCGDHEYQEIYTTETRCQRQPYCDPNKNFEHASHESKEKRTVCKCKPGFHCSSKECINCVPHTICPPGKGAIKVGNHLHDTQCDECPPGTFSNESSWDGVCQKLTECGDDSNTIQAGTATSDTVCEKKSRMYGLGIGIAVLVIFVAIALAFVVYRVFMKPTNAEGKFKNDLKECWGAQKEPLTNVKVVVSPTEEEEESILIDGPIVSTPEENEDELGSQEESMDVRRTENGYPVKQDTKAEQLSQEETQCT